MKSNSVRGLVIILGLSLLLFNAVLAQDGTRSTEIFYLDEQGKKTKVKLYEGKFALIIGAIDYNNGWRKLPGVESDIKPVTDILKKIGFTVEYFPNPTSENFLKVINEFVNKYGFNSKNQLLIYFAGHGHTITTNGIKKGYIVPIDAPNPNENLIGFKQKALTMDQIKTVARRIESNHALFIFDSCFSGTLFSRSRTKTNKVMDYLVSQRVRQFITSGSETEEVPDFSYFRRAFVNGLEGRADTNGDNYITGTELSVYLEAEVLSYEDTKQTPRWGKYAHPDYNKGDFVFVISKKDSITCPNVSVTGPATVTKPGNRMTFTVNLSAISEQSKKDYTYSWSVNKGTIIAGQGTPSITVRTSDLVDTNVKANVSIGGADPSCKLEASEVGFSKLISRFSKLIDEFGKIALDNLIARIDGLVIELSNLPTHSGYIVNYGSARDIRRREQLIRDYMILRRNFPASRLFFVNGGVEPKIRTRLWVVPKSADTSTIN